VARNDDPEPVTRTEGPGRAAPAVTGESREVAIGNNLAIRHLPQGADDVELAGVQPSSSSRYRRGSPLAVEVRPEPLINLSVPGALRLRMRARFDLHALVAWGDQPLP
jgi:hypothetical protein